MEREQEIAQVYILIEKIWGTGALLAFDELIKQYENGEEE